MRNEHRFSVGQKFKSYKPHTYIPLGTIIKITGINPGETYNAQELNKDEGTWGQMDEEFLLDYFKPYKNQPRKIKRIT